MIKTVLIWIFSLVVIGLIVIWLVAGGWSTIVRTAHSLASPLDYLFGESAFPLVQLPWAPSPVRGPDISNYAVQADAKLATIPDDASTPAPQEIVRAQNFGTASPYAGMVAISDNNATANDAAQEYIVVDASALANAPINLSGWSLQSAVSGLRAYLPAGGAELFMSGTVNRTGTIYLDPGEAAIITTGPSPVGVSFRENACTGYLAQLQRFSPELPNTCPNPSDMMPATADNIRTLGSSCLDYAQNLPRCYFPSNIPNDLSPACRAFIGNTMSYNGCVMHFRTSQGFFKTWRVYLGMRAELWYNTHDVVRLLDAQGKTVDMLSY